MTEATGEVAMVVIEKDIALRRMKFKIKSLELNIENSEIRLIELDRDKQKIVSGIDTMKSQIEQVEEEIRKIEESGKNGKDDGRKASGEKA